ncbi:hypothetical protein D3C78_1114400 [compost metagenome]
MFIAEMRTHFLAHFTHFSLQRFAFTRRDQHIAANGVKLRFKLRIAVYHTRTHQRLMLPGPCLVLLIFRKRFGRGNQHPRRTGRAQTRVDFVQNPGRRTSAEQMHHALGKTQIELTSVDFALAIGHNVNRAIVQEDQIQIGAVTQLPAAQFAIAHHGKTTPLAIGQVRWLTVTRHHLPPGLLHHCVDHRFGKPG